LGASDFLKEVPRLVPFPGGAADAEAANAIVRAAVNRVAMLFVFITWVVVSAVFPFGWFLVVIENRLHKVINLSSLKPLENFRFFCGSA
jgi:hypothetical protein